MSLTIDPSNTEGLKDGHKQEAHPAGGVVVKELKYVHTALSGEERTNQNCIRRKETGSPPGLRPHTRRHRADLVRITGDTY